MDYELASAYIFLFPNKFQQRKTKTQSRKLYNNDNDSERAIRKSLLLDDEKKGKKAEVCCMYQIVYTQKGLHMYLNEKRVTLFLTQSLYSLLLCILLLLFFVARFLVI